MSDSWKKYVKQKFDDDKEVHHRKKAGGKHSHRRKFYDDLNDGDELLVGNKHLVQKSHINA
jgi:hypothetical protein